MLGKPSIYGGKTMLRGSTSMSPQINELVKALTTAHANFKLVKKSGKNPFLNSSYATLTDVLESCKDALQENGLVVAQVPSGGGDGCICLTTYLLHSSGQFISGELIMATKDASPQSAGSAITYARRYAYSAILSLSTEDDDDGHAASSTSYSTPSQASAHSAFRETPTQGLSNVPAGDYVVSFGKYKGKSLSQIDPKEIKNYIKYLESSPDGKPPGRNAAEFINLGKLYLDIKSNFGAKAEVPEDIPF